MMDDSLDTLSAAQLDADQSSILVLGVDVSHVRGCLLENVSGTYRLAAWQSTPRRDKAGLDDLAGELLRQMGQRLHRTLWHSRERMPMTTSDDVVREPPLGQVVITASPRPHVRIWLAGLTATQSMAAALDTLVGCPARVIGQTAYMADLQVGPLADAVIQAAPDLVVIVGGYDNPDVIDQQPLLDLCRLFGQVLARSAPAQRPNVVFAGNRWAASRAVEVLQAAGGGLMEAVENVQPSPGVIERAPLAQAVVFAYWRLCRYTDGFKDISRWVTAPGLITSLETSFIQLVQVWMELNDLPALHGLHCGPAWWLHVWATRNQQTVNLRYVEPHNRPEAMTSWPPLQLVSGEWPTALWPKPPLYWCDRSGMTPMIATIGQVAPRAMVEVLRADLFETRRI